jgi:hypothetical protein
MLLGLGLVASDQDVPFQVSTRVSLTEESELEPTAVQAVELVQSTPERALSVLGSAPDTRDHEVPFQDSIKTSSVEPLVYVPTALQFVELTHETDARKL